MEHRDKMRIAVTVAISLAALTLVILTRWHHKRKNKQPSTSCYLQSDQKPQLSFKRVLADNSFFPFKHLNKGSNTPNSHPYEAEITDLIENSPPRAVVELGLGFESGNVKLGMSENYVWVETESQLEELADILSEERVFAVDTEQHNLRSFLGFTALIQIFGYLISTEKLQNLQPNYEISNWNPIIEQLLGKFMIKMCKECNNSGTQISTKAQDYLVDTIALHDVMGVLGPVFANPSICKVFHGADNDVLWLQRDFHIYVVNLFDTAKACETLSKPQKSLAFLLETYCGVATNKLLQREDWRQRPLSAEMLEYARTDAHYLLYIGSCLISELKQLSSGTKDDNASDNPSYMYNEIHFIGEASRRSNMLCLQLYSKETEVPLGESAASTIFSRHLNGRGSSLVSSETQDLLRRLCAWRDIMARIHDESVRFVLSDHSIVSLAAKVPKTPALLYDTITLTDLNSDPANVSSSLQSPSPVVCSHLEDLYFLFHEKDDLENVFQMLLQKCLGPNGSCPLSLCNYALLFNHDLRLSNSTSIKKNGSKNSKHIARKASRDLFVQKFSCKAPVYHNCRIYANDGRLLCYCDRRKLEWYLHRDLAKLVDDNPPAIMLLFEPKGRPEDEDNDFYIQSKKNICVGCGEGSHYLRYRIIPSCYRMHFPEHLKSHRSHDIVLLCVDCHEVAHAAAEKYKKRVAKEFGIPLFVCKVLDSKEQPAISWPDSPTMHLDEAGVSPLQLRTAAMALLRHGQRMPPGRRAELMQIVIQYYGGRDITDEDLERALLVGMSPHERRKFEKKRRFSLKQCSGKNLQDTKQNNVDPIVASDSAPTIDDSFYGNCGESCSSGAADLHCLGHNESTPSKLSLLGHGPHGKQVVDHIQEQYGEDGIREFCQRWRKVFVEATQPRFLPAGWDVMHRDLTVTSVLTVAEGILVNSACTTLPRKHLLPIVDAFICHLLQDGCCPI